MWLVDYDLPSPPSPGAAYTRVKFHRQLKTWAKELGASYDMSTASVLKTGSRELALKVHDLAKDIGKSNLYWAVKMNGTEEKLNDET